MSHEIITTPSALLAPIRIGVFEVPNRIAVAPMTNQQSAADGTLRPAEIDWIVQRAEGGFGLVITGAWAVSPEGRTWPGQTSFHSPQNEQPLAELGRRITATSAIGIVQLIHAGSRATPEITHEEGISAAAGATWRAASDADIHRILDNYRDAALQVQRAGLHGIEIHAAHGFLPAQFLSRTENTRNDEWSGTLPARARFLRTLVRTVRDAVGTGFVIGVRLSPEDLRRGIDLDETAQVASWLAEDSVDYLHLSLGDATALSTSLPPRHPVEVIRAAVAALPLIGAGKMWTPQQALDLLEHGADIAALGQAAILTPNWPKHASEPGWAPQPRPLTRDELARVGVTDPFFLYLQDGWPALVNSAGQASARH